MADSNLIFYNSVDLFHPEKSNLYAEFVNEKPGFDLFQYMFRIFAANLSLVDRTKTLTTPLNMQLLDCCKLPNYDPDFSLDFTDICQARARWFLDYAQNTNRKIVVMYSGGIDSTLILSSFIMVGTVEELKNNIVVLLTNTSIDENPTFYRNHVLKKFTLESGYAFQNFLGNPKYIVVTGEGNDQLFGSAVMHRFVLKKGPDIITATPTSSLISELINESVHDREKSEKITELFNRVVNSAPMKIETVNQYFWWLNFTLKWQSVYMRMVAYTSPKFRSTVKIEDNYFTFFHAPDFQKWVMRHPDQLIRETWASYKWKCKEVIFEVNPDENYRDNKTKFGSLIRVVTGKHIAKCIDSNGVFYDTVYPSDCWNDMNDFI